MTECGWENTWPMWVISMTPELQVPYADAKNLSLDETSTALTQIAMLRKARREAEKGKKK
jgi:hypothetical protein